jgi:1-deoxy-D-xylulose-5-phosphate reductoisomerase
MLKSRTADSVESECGRAPRRLTILGSTGSIGRSTLDLVERNPAEYEIAALTGQNNVKLLAEQALTHRAQLAVIGEESLYGELKDALAGTDVKAAAGAEAITEAGALPVDYCMAAIVGAAGLRPSLAAIRNGGTIGLANKECLVCAGELFMKAVENAGATLLPVDSEHSAAFQAIDNAPCDGVEQIQLTASGGPFRTWSAEEMARVTVEQALKHPNWSMGPKITIDSATMMNKGLELIEAFHLFPVTVEQLGVVVHPQSIIHCLVHYRDGSVIAQLGSPDMRTPIAYSLAWPKRMQTPVKRLNLAALGTLTFEAPDDVRFPALRIARAALKSGGYSTIILNAANEIAVASFLSGQLSFMGIPALVEETLDKSDTIASGRPECLDDVFAADTAARRVAASLTSSIAARHGAA